MRKRKWASALCWGCKFHNATRFGTCKAFPEGIPHVIISNEEDHFTTIEGQNNEIVYEMQND